MHLLRDGREHLRRDPGRDDAPVTVDEIDREAHAGRQRVARPAVAGQPDPSRWSRPGRPIPQHGGASAGRRQGHSRCPSATIGELALRSDCMLTGYYHRPDATEKAFLDGWYLTGDFGYMADGEVYVAGRKKDLIIVGGKNVYPQDLELLAMQVPGVHAGRVVRLWRVQRASRHRGRGHGGRGGYRRPGRAPEASPTTSAWRSTAARPLPCATCNGRPALDRQDQQRQDRPPGQPGEVPEGDGRERERILGEAYAD